MVTLYMYELQSFTMHLQQRGDRAEDEQEHRANCDLRGGCGKSRSGAVRRVKEGRGEEVVHAAGHHPVQGVRRA